MKEKCTTGTSKLFPQKQCKNKVVEYLFGDPYCKSCADELRKVHKQLCEGK